MDAPAALALLKQYGSTPDSFLTLGAFERFTTNGIAGYIAVRRTRRLVLCISDPVCDPKDRLRLVHALRLDASGKKQRLAFLSTSKAVRDDLELMDFGSIKTGDEAVFDLATYSFATPERREVRQSANKAEREGVTIRAARSSDRPHIETLIREWISTRKSEGFSLMLGLDPDLFEEEKRVFVAEKDSIVGFLSCTPIYAQNGWYFEDIIRSARAPRGVNHLLIREAVQVLLDEGYCMATLGAAPLGRLREGEAHERRLLNRTLEFAYEHFNAFYNFKGLYDFKSSFAPTTWEPQYLCFYPRRLTPTTLISIVDANIPGGIPRAVRKRFSDALSSVPTRASRTITNVSRRASRAVRRKR